MANITMTLSVSDYQAALQQWVASPTGGSKQTTGAPGPTPHAMDLTVTPIHNTDGTTTIALLF